MNKQLIWYCWVDVLRRFPVERIINWKRWLTFPDDQSIPETRLLIVLYPEIYSYHFLSIVSCLKSKCRRRKRRRIMKRSCAVYIFLPVRQQFSMNTVELKRVYVDMTNRTPTSHTKLYDFERISQEGFFLNGIPEWQTNYEDIFIYWQKICIQIGRIYLVEIE